jgi:hypothetical protein
MHQMHVDEVVRGAAVEEGRVAMAVDVDRYHHRVLRADAGDGVQGNHRGGLLDWLGVGVSGRRVVLPRRTCSRSPPGRRGAGTGVRGRRALRNCSRGPGGCVPPSRPASGGETSKAAALGRPGPTTPGLAQPCEAPSVAVPGGGTGEGALSAAAARSEWPPRDAQKPVPGAWRPEASGGVRSTSMRMWSGRLPT